MYPAPHTSLHVAAPAALTVPAGHERHTVTPAGEYVFSRHQRQISLPVSLLYFPAMHAMQAPERPVYPAPHGPSMQDTSGCALTLPTGHQTQFSLPVTFLYVPGRHAEHWPGFPMYPASHGALMQPAAGAALILPAGHATHVAELTTVGLTVYMPDGHLVQVALPYVLDHEFRHSSQTPPFTSV